MPRAQLRSAVSEDTSRSVWVRLAWFVGLWAVGVAVVGVVGLVIKLAIAT
jgi:hypothetical protein